MSCKGICPRYKAQKPTSGGRYAAGQMRCQICEIFLKWEGLWCPCCGYRLRGHPRNKVYKEKFRGTVDPRDKKQELPQLVEGAKALAYVMDDGVMRFDAIVTLVRKTEKQPSDSRFENWLVKLNKKLVERFILSSST